MSQKNNMQIYNFHVEDTYDDRLHMILSTKLLCINYYSEYGIGNPLAITTNTESPFERFIRYFKKNTDLKMSNDDFSVLKRILRKIHIKTSSNISQKDIINLLSNNKRAIIELFNEDEIEQMTDEQLRIQRDILNKKLNFPTKKKGQCNLSHESKKKIINKLKENVVFRKSMSSFIHNYDDKLKHVENTGEPMLITEEDLKSTIEFSTDIELEGTFLSKEIVDQLQKEGAEVIWN